MMTRLRLQARLTALAAAMAFTLSGTLPAASQSAAPEIRSTQAPATEAAANPSIAAPEKPRKPAAARGGGSGHVYLLRGLLNVFSLGMDDLAAKLQARGVSASVHNHADWQGIADAIAEKYKAGKHGPVILIGHSLGADAVMIQAEYLGKKGVPVALVVPFDGTGSHAAGPNVARVMNLTQRDYAYMRRGSGFRGQLQNIDVSNDSSIDHINIDKSGRLHSMVVGAVLGVLGRGGAPKPDTGTASSSSTSTVPTAAASPAPSASAAPKAQ